MLRKHAAAMAKLTADKTLKSLVCDYFNLTPRNRALTPLLYQRGLGQADLVLALLRIEHPRSRHYIGLLIGHPITIAPPCLLRYNLHVNTARPSTTRPSRVDNAKITYVQDTNPRQPGTESHLRWPWFQVGRTVAQLRVRGVKRRDIAKAIDFGWIKIEEVQHAASH